MHPYEVAQTLRSRAKHESIRLNFGSLYSVVETPREARPDRARETVREGRRPERTVYEITDAGARELTDWLSELVSTPAKEYLQFEAALSLLPALPPDEVLGVLRQRADALEVRLRSPQAHPRRTCKAGLPRLFVLEERVRRRACCAPSSTSSPACDSDIETSGRARRSRGVARLPTSLARRPTAIARHPSRISRPRADTRRTP